MKAGEKGIVAKSKERNFVNELKQIVLSARKQAYSAINLSQVCTNWLIGQRIVEQEQAGQNRAEYGKHLIKLVAQELTNEFGNGYSETNIKSFRRFYLEYQNIIKRQAVPAQLNNNFQQTELAIKQALINFTCLQ